MNNDNLCVFLDQVGRTIFAENLPERSNDKLLTVKNPVVVHITQKPTGEMALQLLPIFFKEFLEDKNSDMVFTFNRDVITVADGTKFDEKLHRNYYQMFSPITLVETPEETEASVPAAKNIIKLFDDEKK